jgi:hypothetical protein
MENWRSVQLNPLEHQYDIITAVESTELSVNQHSDMVDKTHHW